MTSTSGALVSVAVVLIARLAAASEPDDQAAARLLFKEGRRLVAAGDYPAACAKFEESERLYSGVGTKFNLADCWERLGRTASAWAGFMEVVAQTRASGQSEREQVARVRAAALEPKLSTLTVVVDAGAPGLDIRRDDVSIGRTSWGVPLPTDPGDHVVRASAPGKRPWSSTVRVPAASGAITVSVPALADAASEESPALVATPIPAVQDPVASDGLNAPAADLIGPSSPPPRVRRHAGPPVFVSAAVGIGAMALGGVYLYKLDGRNEEARQICPSGNYCTPQEDAAHDELLADARRDRLISFVALGVGVAALAASVALWWRSGQSP